MQLKYLESTQLGGGHIIIYCQFQSDKVFLDNDCMTAIKIIVIIDFSFKM